MTWARCSSRARRFRQAAFSQDGCSISEGHIMRRHNVGTGGPLCSPRLFLLFGLPGLFRSRLSET